MLESPTVGLAAFIADLAQWHDIVSERASSSALAQVITRLSGDERTPDHTEQLVIALWQAEVIDAAEMVEIIGRYFDETTDV